MNFSNCSLVRNDQNISGLEPIGNLKLKKAKILYIIVGLSLLISMLLSACGSNDSEATPTLSVELIQTLAVVTFTLGQTQTAIAMPSNTPTPTATSSPTATSTLAVTNTPGTPRATSGGVIPTASCYSMAFVADVTIPDNTNMKPGQTFTKTWRVRNNGTCAWESGFKFTFTSGNSMGGATLTLDKAVSAGTETELSIAMTAPNTSGSYQGNWRMANASGTNFGDEVFVLIVVSGTASSTSTNTATSMPTQATATPTATETPTETPTTSAP